MLTAWVTLSLTHPTPDTTVTSATAQEGITTGEAVAIGVVVVGVIAVGAVILLSGGAMAAPILATVLAVTPPAEVRSPLAVDRRSCRVHSRQRNAPSPVYERWITLSLIHPTRIQYPAGCRGIHLHPNWVDKSLEQ